MLPVTRAEGGGRVLLGEAAFVGPNIALEEGVAHRTGLTDVGLQIRLSK